jgi:hypothetical protein
LDKANIRKATDESTTMAKTRRTPRPQKSPAKANAEVNKMKGDATTAPHSPKDSDDSYEPDVPDKAEVKEEVEQNIKVDEIVADDCATVIQSVLEAAAAVVSLSGATTKKAVPAAGPKKPNAKKPSPSKRKTLAPKAKKPGPPSDDQVFWLRFFEFCRYKADHGTTTAP